MPTACFIYHIFKNVRLKPLYEIYIWTTTSKSSSNHPFTTRFTSKLSYPVHPLLTHVIHLHLTISSSTCIIFSPDNQPLPPLMPHNPHTHSHPLEPHKYTPKFITIPPHTSPFFKPLSSCTPHWWHKLILKSKSVAAFSFVPPIHTIWRVCTHMQLRMYSHTCVHTHTHTCTNTYTHTHTHTHAQRYT